MRILLSILLLIPTFVAAEVVPPNYDFSMDTLADFFPEKELTAIETKYGKGEVRRDDGSIKMIRSMVSQIRYVLAIVVQTSQGKVVDMHARLPSYFLHDIFHHSLIKRWGSQQTYKRVDEEAFYEWKSEQYVMNYGASCTITCFPTYFSVKPSPEKSPGGFRAISELLNSRQTRP